MRQGSPVCCIGRSLAPVNEISVTKKILLGVALACAGVLAWQVWGGHAQPVRVGILHSLTGTMAISETSVRDATLLAIEELNAAGGVLGRRIEPVVADGRSEGELFASEGERLSTNERVADVFGCWTSSSRKTSRPGFD